MTNRLSVLILATMALMPMAPGQAADDPAAYTRPGENLALGKSYALQPAPGYSHCTDPGDTTQLTDGAYSDGYFWTQPSTVGWQNAKPAVVAIDLGSDQPIRGLSLRSAAGTAGVFWPVGIYVFTAGEDKVFHWAGDLVSLSEQHSSPPKDGYSTHRYWTDTLKTHGRYVTIAAVSEPYFFVDEIEVYAGEPAWTSTPLPGEPVNDVVAFMKRLSVKVSVERRITHDVNDLRALLQQTPIDEAVRTAIAGDLDSAALAITSLPVAYDEKFRAVLPLNEVHARVFCAQARLWSAVGAAPLLTWQSPLWDMIPLIGIPDSSAPAQISVWMMNNEYRAAAFNLSNATQAPMDLTLRFEGIPGSPMPSWITVHEAAWTDTKTLVPVVAALPEAKRDDNGYHIRVEPGLTRQVWMTFHPVDQPAAEHRGEIVVAQAGQEPLRVPLAVQVYPFRFPDQAKLHCGGWDYTDQPAMYGVTPENREPLIAHLRERFVDSPWGTSAVLPYGAYNAEGHMIEKPDTAHFDAWIDRWSGAAQYCVFAAVAEHLNSMPMGTAPFEQAAREWFTFWAGHIRVRGLKPEQFAVLVFDEPHAHEHDAVIKAWAAALRKAETGIRIWEDPTYADINGADPEMLALCDVLCPNLPLFVRGSEESRQRYIQERDAGRALEFYSCSGPMRLLDPYVYCRLQPWTCWEYKAGASYFWAFGDDGNGVSWNEYAAGRTAYTPVFLDATSVTAGKHMEAIREGIEDYEYLAILEEAIASASSRGVSAETIARAKELLVQGPARVRTVYTQDTDFWWKAECDRTVADAVRREILDMLVALDGAS
ncbi:MAG: hypothetical protein IT365_05910 [Candidatus Hydrogenedentes bacterium]|nr:hypothetical protein [Candidatus Hydrogenedentota bacterium]